MPVPSPCASRPWRLWSALAAAAALLLAPAPAQARPGVTVAEFNDATGRSYGERARTAIVRALADADSVELVPFAKVKTIAANRRIRPLDLAKPKILGKMSQIAGAETVVVCKVGKRAYLAVNKLQASGFADVKILDGGVTAWPFESE